MKKETLEEAAKNATKIYINEREKQTAYLEFINGAKWQAERMYSEEEVMNIIDSFIDNLQDYTPTFNSRQEWFEQFKKK